MPRRLFRAAGLPLACALCLAALLALVGCGDFRLACPPQLPACGGGGAYEGPGYTGH